MTLRTLLLVISGAALGSVLTWMLVHRSVEPVVPPAPVVVERMREVARLETLDLQVYKKIAYAPEPTPTGALWSDVLAWAKASLFPTRGRAIVFGTVHLGVDLSRLDARRLRIQGSRIEIALPPLQAQVELRPGETEIIASNLDSAETAHLLESREDGLRAGGAGGSRPPGEGAGECRAGPDRAPALARVPGGGVRRRDRSVRFRVRRPGAGRSRGVWHLAGGSRPATTGRRRPNASQTGEAIRWSVPSG